MPGGEAASTQFDVTAAYRERIMLPPGHVLTVKEAETVLAVPDLDTLTGHGEQRRARVLRLDAAVRRQDGRVIIAVAPDQQLVAVAERDAPRLRRQREATVDRTPLRRRLAQGDDQLRGHHLDLGREIG